MPTVRYDIEAMRGLATEWGRSAAELAEIRLDTMHQWSSTQLTPQRVADVKLVVDALMNQLSGPNEDSLASLTATAGAYLRRDADSILLMEQAKGGAGALAAAALLAKRFNSSSGAFLKWPSWTGR